MKAIIKTKYIYLTEKPKKDIIDGLWVEFDKKELSETALNLSYTDIKKGQRKYEKPNVPVKIIKAWVKTDKLK